MLACLSQTSVWKRTKRSTRDKMKMLGKEGIAMNIPMNVHNIG